MPTYKKYFICNSIAQILVLIPIGTASAQVTLPPNTDIATSVTAGNYNLILGGQASWNAPFYIDTAARSNLTINGGGNTILVGPSNYLITDFLLNNTVSIKNATVTTNAPITSDRLSLFNYSTVNVNSALNLEGSTFKGFSRANGYGGSIINVFGLGTNVRVDGGTTGVTFSGNRGVFDAAGVAAVYNGNLTFDGKVTFDSNWTGNYGGAVAIYSFRNFLTFNGDTTFKKNHAVVFGGALDVWGGPSTITFNGPTSFDGNYIYYTDATSTESPIHVTDQHPRGGAINIGYVSPGVDGTSLIFNSPTSFTNNYVVSTGAGKNALGGAISVYGNNVALLYRLTFNDSALFQGNYVYATGGSGNGGAIFYDSSAAVISLTSGTQFLNNYAKTNGGAIYLQSGTVNLNAATDDIVFQGNRQGVSFDASYKPITTTGTPNAIYLGSSGSLNMATAAGQTIHFYDPVASVGGSTVTVTKSGAGEAIFHGNGTATTLYDSNIQGNTVIQGGYLTLSNGVKYGSTTGSTLVANTTGTIRGNTGAELRSGSVTIQSGGTLAVNGGAFTVNSPSITLQAGSALAGFGTLAATSNLNLTGGVAANVTGTDTLTVSRAMVGSGSITKSGTGTLGLSALNTYTGATTINAGTLSAGIANAFATSNAVTVNSGATLALNGYNQTAQNLSGGGTLTLGSAALTATNAANTQFSGNISGTGSLSKTGTGTLTLSGTNAYSGGTTISQGRLIASNSGALGTGTVANAGTFELNFAGSGTLNNRLTGAGALQKTGIGTATLTGTSSSVGATSVTAGTLALAQGGIFTASSYTTGSGATTTIGSSSKLAVTGAFTQSAGSTLNAAIGANDPVITAGSATIGGSLAVSGYIATYPVKASDLSGTQYAIIKTTSGITGNFSSVNFDDFVSPTDFLTLTGQKSADTLNYNVGMGLTWLAGTQHGNGIFTLPTATDAFNVDVVLANQTGPFTSGWNGSDLTKNGAGTLTLSAANTYTGATTINGGTLSTGVVNAFANSSAVTVGSGATLALAGHNQTAQNLSGSGTISLGAAALTASNANNTIFSGAISGTGSLSKTGAGSLTLSGTNAYSGGTTISQGRLIATGSASLGTGAVINGSILELALAANGTIANRLNGAGTIEKTGSSTVTLTNAASSVGTMDVKAGTLALAQNGTFTAGTYTTEAGATTTIGTSSKLAVSGVFTQAAGSTLTVGVGLNAPAITADTAFLDGTLAVSGVNTSRPLKASELHGKQFTLLETTGGITGDFSSISFGTAASPADYLTLAGWKSADTLSYSVGMGLTWLADSQNGNGVFTLSNTTDAFNVDLALADQSGPFTSGWNGSNLTKNGAGSLTLSAVNTYTGTTTVNGGTLVAGIDNAFADSTSVVVNSGATLAFNNHDQIVQNLSGTGRITLGSAVLTADNTADTTFGGIISGTGSLDKTGTGTLTLSGSNTYSGGTTISQGRLVADNSSAFGSGAVIGGGTVVLDFAADGILGNQLIGMGDFEKTGTGTTTLTHANSSVGTMDVQAGILALNQDGTFTAGTFTTGTGATTAIGTSSTLSIGGVFTQAAGSSLDVGIGATLPAITAGTAALDGNLAIAGFDITLPASVLTATRHTILQTTGGITGDFSSVTFGGVTTGVDYLLLNGGKTAGDMDYEVGFAMVWTSGATLGNGSFTLLDEANVFNVDVLLADQVASTTGWNGRDLTKNGDGTLILSYANTYTGTTTVNGGTLSLAENAALGQTSMLDIGTGATVALNGTSQTVGNLTTLAGSRLNFGGGILTISDAQRTPGDTNGGSIQANTLFGTGGLIIDPSIVTAYGANAGYVGDVTVTGGSQLIMNNGAGVGNSGLINLVATNDLLTFETLSGVPATGTLEKMLVGNGTLQTRNTADITLAGNNSAFSGLFDIAGGTTLRASNADNLGFADITLAGTLAVTTATDWMMINPVTGSGSFLKDGAGTLLVNSALTGFTGQTQVMDGTLVVGTEAMNTARIGGGVTVDAAATLSGTGTVDGIVVNNGTIAALNALPGHAGASATNLALGPLTNAGTIQLAGSTAGNTLTVKGGMTSQNGTLVINTVLGGDTSRTDKLILDGGTTTGSTSLLVRNQSGRGGQTERGILVVDAINGATTTADAFSLSSSSSGYRTTTGTLAIGAYDYSLMRAGTGGASDSWYLTSTMAEARPEAGVYLVNRDAAERMFTHTMRDRLEGHETIIDPVTGVTTLGAAWARVYTNRRTSYAGGENLRTTTDTTAFQTGLDLFGWSDETYGSIRAGVMLGAGTAKSDTDALWDRSYAAKGTIDGYSVGLYATWFQNPNQRDGFYVDTWTQYAWYNNDTQGKGLSKESYKSRLWAASLEGGYSFTLSKTATSSLSLDPFLQIIQSSYSADDFMEAGGTRIRQSDHNKTTTRAGARLHGMFTTEGGYRLEPFVEANWWHSSNTGKIFMDDNVIYSDMPRDIGELKIGLKSEVAKNLFLSVDVSAQMGEHNYRQYGGQVGLKYVW